MITEPRIRELLSEHSDGYGRIEDLTALTRALEQESRPQLPPLDDELADILGRPNFMCGNLAKILRFKGQAIAYRAEAEQAAVIYFLLQLYLEHGAAWRNKAEEYFREALQIINTAISEQEKRADDSTPL